MELTLRLYGLINKIAYFLLAPLLMLIFGGLKERKKVPKIDNPMLELCAVDLAEKIRNQQVSVTIQGLFGVKHLCRTFKSALLG